MWAGDDRAVSRSQEVPGGVVEDELDDLGRLPVLAARSTASRPGVTSERRTRRFSAIETTLEATTTMSPVLQDGAGLGKDG
jgi:hypothetical protein